jgi:hypothetical protein
MSKLNTKQQYPIKHPSAGVNDGRWSITKGHTGNYNNIGQPDYVVRFCDDFVSAHTRYDDAKEAAQEHADKHFNNL